MSNNSKTENSSITEDGKKLMWEMLDKAYEKKKIEWAKEEEERKKQEAIERKLTTKLNRYLRCFGRYIRLFLNLLEF